MAGDIERMKYVVKLNGHQCCCLIAELHKRIKDELRLSECH